jgi:uroporphyrinogen decarboxylase
VNSKQRVQSAVNHQQPDRVPITFDAEAEVYEALYKYLHLETKEQLFDRLHVDTWMLLPKNFIYPDDQLNSRDKTSIWGYQTRFTPYEGGAYDELVYSPLAGKHNLSDIDNHPWPADDLVQFSHYTDQSHAQHNRAIIGVFTWGAYFIATHVRGMEDLMLDFVTRKDYARHLIDTIAEKSFHYLDTMLDQHSDDIDFVYMADDYCSQLGPMFSPAAFEEFVMPYLTRFADRIHASGKKFLLHVCGSVRALLPMIIEAGVDMLEPIQIRAKGMEPAGLKKDFGDKMCFYGGMDLQRVLNTGTVRQVQDETKRLIDILNQEGGYVFGPGHTYIQIDAPVENILAMYDTAYTHRS